MSRAAEIINFLEGLSVTGTDLPKGIQLVNPHQQNPEVMQTVRLFYQKYYGDGGPRILILGINPGRLGAGMRGIPFTDPKRLVSVLGVPYSGKVTHEPSSVFVYDMITAYGGPEKFYKAFYIGSLFPLTIVKYGNDGKFKNYNYYDDAVLLEKLRPPIVENIRLQLEISGSPGACICLGTGRNAQVLRRLNDQYHFFERIEVLEHPRF